MIVARSMIDGSILGMAADLEIATVMSQANDWPSWYAESRDTPDFSILPREPDTDPRNARGHCCARRPECRSRRS